MNHIKKIMPLKKILLFITLCVAAAISDAQQIKSVSAPVSYRAINLTVQDGLSAYDMHAMIKDSKGFLWIGSSIMGGELCRFDGSTFKKYIPDPQKSDALNSYYIQSFEEDSLHNIWIGTGKGISRYDSKADTFTNFLPLIDTGSSSTNDIWNPLLQMVVNAGQTIVPFWATKDEVFCMEPEGLITTFNIHTLARRKLVQLSKKDDPGITWNTNHSFFDAGSNSIWVLKHYEQYRGGGLEKIFP